ncbi:MAG: multiple sugar transport system permease protein [Kosmotogales bacterium]|nr:multiple sugar transport system permease protein [Kosmotogales bacterium]
MGLLFWRSEFMKDIRKSRIKMIFALNVPAVTVILVLLLLPLAIGFGYTFFKISFMKHSFKFIGLANYIEAFSDSEVISSIIRTLLYSIISISMALVSAIGMALMLNKDFVGNKICRALIMIPWALPPIVNGIAWNWFFNPRYGFFTNVLLKLGIIDKPINFLTGNISAFIIVCIATVYWLLPFSIIYLLALLKTIPKSVYEAAEIDGASKWQRFTKITLPLLLPGSGVLIIWLAIRTLKSYDIIYALTEGGPGRATTVLNYLAYSVSFKTMDFGMGATISFILSIMIFLFSILYYRFSFREYSY